MNLKKTWKVFYYEYDLTVPVTKMFYTQFAAMVYSYWTCMRTGFTIRVTNIND